MSIDVVVGTIIVIVVAVMGYVYRGTTVTGGFGGKNFAHCILKFQRAHSSQFQNLS